MDQRRPVPGEFHVDKPLPEQKTLLCGLRPYVRQSGDEYRLPWHLKSRKLLDYLIVYIAEGTGKFTVAGQEYDVSKDDFFWVPPDTAHEMEGFAPRMRCLWIHFDLVYDPDRSHWDARIPGDVLDLSLLKPLMHPPMDLPVISKWCGKLPVSNPSTILGIMECICVEHHRYQSGTVLLLSGMMLQLLAEIIRGTLVTESSSPQQATALQEAITSIQENPGAGLDVSALAARFRLSASHFRRLFHLHHGKSPRAVNRQAFLRKACTLLVYHNLTISEVAFELGYSSVHNFSRAFRTMTGMSPRQYRKGNTSLPKIPGRDSHKERG